MISIQKIALGSESLVTIARTNLGFYSLKTQQHDNKLHQLKHTNPDI